MKYRNIILPDDLMPDEEHIENARRIEEEYVELYELLMKDCENATPSSVIYLMAKMNAEVLALMIGASLTDHDKDVLMGVIERQIVKKVFIE